MNTTTQLFLRTKIWHFLHRSFLSSIQYFHHTIHSNDMANIKGPNCIRQHWVFTCMSASLRAYSVEKAGAGTSSPPTGDGLSKTHSRDSTYRGSMQPQWCTAEPNQRNTQSQRTEAKVYTTLKQLALNDKSQSPARFIRTRMLYELRHEKHKSTWVEKQQNAWCTACYKFIYDIIWNYENMHHIMKLNHHDKWITGLTK